jgi:hypothetical protein
MVYGSMPDKRNTYLTLLHEEGPDDHGNTWAVCRCICGGITRVMRRQFRLKITRSCGCKRGELIAASKLKHGAARHGKLRTTEYRIWSLVLQRCNNPNNPAYESYGGRGITVCKRWLKFENFLKDMGKRPAGLTLDRRNNSKGYSKSNCRWATRLEQVHNRRPYGTCTKGRSSTRLART